MAKRSTPSHFWSRVAVNHPDACWHWTGAKHRRSGYGEVKFTGSKWQAHRLAFFLHFGTNPGPDLVRHRCDNRICCNPAHLETGTHLDNARDRVERGRNGDNSGATIGGRKLTAEQVRYIRANPKGLLQRELAAELGIIQNMVSKIRLRRAWANL